MIGTMDGDGDSRGENDVWRVNCLNMWKATLGKRLCIENAILSNLIVTIHELSHISSGEPWCNENWDKTICKSVLSSDYTEIWPNCMNK